MEIITILLLVALVGAAILIVREREKSAGLEKTVEHLQGELATAHEDRPQLEAFQDQVQDLSGALERAEQRDGEAQRLISSLETKVDQGNRRIDGLVGRWSNPKQRSQLGESWLAGALQRMNLAEGAHFETQKRVVIIGRRGKREGVIDILLYLPSGDGIVLDSKFPWAPHLQQLIDGPEEARDHALGKLRDALRSHVRDIAGREYRCAQGITIRHVLVVVPDWHTLELAKAADPQIGQFAADLGVGLLPAGGLYEIAAALGELHREKGWGEKIHSIFAPEDADRMYNACRDLLERVETAVKRHNSAGDALAEIQAAFSPNGMMRREVLGPAARAAEKIAAGSTAEVKQLDEEKTGRHAERLRDQQQDLERRIEHPEAA